MHPLVCQAIQERRLVTLQYAGGRRQVEPHAHGTSAEGHPLLLGFQVGGHSSSGTPQGWKMFRLDGTSHLALSDRTFTGAREGYEPANRAMASVHCRL